MSDILHFASGAQTSDEEPAVPAGETPAPSWSDLVERVRVGEPAALEELYLIFSKGIRFYLCRQLGPQDLDDKVHDIFLIITQAIQSGDLREPDRLMGYVRTVVRRQVAAHIDHAVHTRRHQTSLETGIVVRDRDADPERKAILHENMTVAMRILDSIPKRDREVLIRFYLKEQSPAEICREMELSETQFRLIKSRAKARFGELGRARLSHRIGYLQKLPHK
jgi:RNA polymerase sigma factor (sigma-70 family)